MDHGAVALVLVLNRLMAPRPLYRIVDLLATTLIAEHLGIPKDTFNDDRLGRTLDALAEHLPAIWNEIQQQALLQYQIDLSVLFYDLTALIMTGQYPKRELVDYGFAHTTPMDDPKVKLGLVISQDGVSRCSFSPGRGARQTKPRFRRICTSCGPSSSNRAGKLLRSCWWAIVPIATASWPLPT